MYPRRNPIFRRGDRERSHIHLSRINLSRAHSSGLIRHPTAIGREHWLRRSTRQVFAKWHGFPVAKRKNPRAKPIAADRIKRSKQELLAIGRPRFWNVRC